MKLTIRAELSGDDIRLLLKWHALRNPEVMERSYPNRVGVLSDLLREEIRRYGMYNRDGWSDDLNEDEQCKIEAWAEIYCRRFAV